MSSESIRRNWSIRRGSSLSSQRRSKSAKTRPATAEAWRPRAVNLTTRARPSVGSGAGQLRTDCECFTVRADKISHNRLIFDQTPYEAAQPQSG